MRWRARLFPPRQLGASSLLQALTADLDRVGIHTLADARLLRRLQLVQGRAGALSRALEKRTREALEQVAQQVRQAELALLAGQPLPGAATQLDRQHQELTRAARIADVFSLPIDAPTSDQSPPEAPPSAVAPREPGAADNDVSVSRELKGPSAAMASDKSATNGPNRPAAQ